MIETQSMNHRRRGAIAIAVLATLALLTTGIRADASDDAARIERIELKADAASTKVIVLLSRPIAFDVKGLDGDAAKKSARRLVLDFGNTTLAPEAAKPIEVANDLLRQIRPGQFNAQTARVVLDLASDAKHTIEAFETPPHVTIALADAASAGMPPTTDPAAEAPPPAAADAAPAKEAPATVSGAAAEAPAAAAGSSQSPARTIPIRARGRKPYSLNYAR